MKQRLIPLLTLVLLLATLAPLSGQSRGVLGTVAVEAPVTLLPEPGRTPLATLPEGTQVQVLDAPEDGWYRIAFQDNYLFGDRVGYVRAEHVRVSGRVPGAAPARELTPGAAHKIPIEAEPRSEAPASNGTPAPTNGAATVPPAGSKSEPSRRRARPGLSESSIATAIILGKRQQDGSDGLQLLETGARATPEASNAAETRSRFRLRIHTPLTWIRQQASDAAKTSRGFGLDDVTDEMTEPVLRIVAYSSVDSKPNAVNAPGWARHIVLRSESKAVVVQPLSKEAFAEHVLRANGGTTVLEGVRVTFPLNAVRKLRGPAGDAEFFVTVTGTTGEQRDVRITRTHLTALPM